MVEMKGRVACEISNHEVLISHLLYENFFNDFEPAEAVALLSCFVLEQVIDVSIFASECPFIKYKYPQ